jgi:membrane-bound lytic murein transglycosylase D
LLRTLVPLTMAALSILAHGCTQSQLFTSGIYRKMALVSSHPQNDNTGLRASNGDSVEPKKTAIQNGSEESIYQQLVAKSHGMKQSAQNFTAVQAILDEALVFCEVSQDFWHKGDLENAVEALDQAYSLILKVDTHDIPILIQQKEDLRFMISKRILEIYASRNIVVNGKHNAIPLTMNKHVKAEIYKFTKGGEKIFFREAYRRSGRYRQHIESVLIKAGLPPELSWIPLIESGFKVDALSKARALGLWQFIPSTGYKFGLKRDAYIDERLDPYKSTSAAIEYLKELHQIFGDWSTVLAAYNCGEGRVLRVIRGQNINYLDNFWDLYQRLPRETARYVPRFIATLHIVKNPQKYGIDPEYIEQPMFFKTVEVTRRLHLKQIAKNIDTSVDTLKMLNPELRKNLLPEKKYDLRVPPDKREILVAKLDQIPMASVSRSTYKRKFIKHRVKPGETLSTISLKYNTSVNQISRANRLKSHNYIVVGSILKIPQPSSKASKKASKNKKINTSSRQLLTHVVVRGDSLWIIANKYGTDTKEIQEVNGLKTSNLHIGQTLKIPAEKEKTSGASQDGSTVYSVKPGDSPFLIAKRLGIPLEEFLRINHLTPRSKIYPGQQLFME